MWHEDQLSQKGMGHFSLTPRVRTNSPEWMPSGQEHWSLGREPQPHAGFLLKLCSWFAPIRHSNPSLSWSGKDPVPQAQAALTQIFFKKMQRRYATNSTLHPFQRTQKALGSSNRHCSQQWGHYLLPFVSNSNTQSKEGGKGIPFSWDCGNHKIGH